MAITWRRDLEPALDEAKRTGGRVLLYFGAAPM